MTARQARTAITLVVLLALLVVGVVVGWRSLSAPVKPDAHGSGPSCVEGLAKGERVRSRQVTVSVYNAGNRPGLAAETLDRLVSRGFIGGEVGNAPDRFSGVRTVSVLAPTRRDPAARLVARQFGPATAVRATRTNLGPGVDVIVGNGLRAMAKAPRSLVAQARGSGC